MVISVCGDDYDIQSVEVQVDDRAEVETDLEFCLFADSANLTKAGFAINCITVPGIRHADELSGLSIVLDGSDRRNELAESVICIPGRVLWILNLRIAFGTIADNRVHVDVEATCETRDEGIPGGRPISVHGAFAARVKIRRPYAS